MNNVLYITFTQRTWTAFLAQIGMKKEMLASLSNGSYILPLKQPFRGAFQSAKRRDML